MDTRDVMWKSRLTCHVHLPDADHILTVNVLI